MTFERADFGAIEALWKRFYPSKYAVDASLLKLNTVECPVFDWGASQIYAPDGKIEGFVIVKKSACPSLFKGPDPDQAHISAIAFEDPFIGVDLFAETKRNLRNRGIYKLVFGQDCRHFFPGCPDECGNLRDFLRVEGFEETSESFDLERDLSDYEVPDVLPQPEGAVEMRPLNSLDKAALSEFLLREFPGRWHYDTMTKVDAEERLDFISGLFLDDELYGFAVTQDPSHQLPIGGAVWKESLGSDWGALGPIGVSASVRGRGLGHGLLAFGLKSLRDQGAKQTLIDWTGLEKFYGAHGFTIQRRYTGLALRLDV